VMHATERDREFIARFAAQRAWLDVPKMMRVRWLAAADEARLLSDEAQMFAISVPARRSERQDALINSFRPIAAGVRRLRFLLHPGYCEWSTTCASRSFNGDLRRKLGKLLLECLLEEPSVLRNESVFCDEGAISPGDRELC
jgi:hypothetical protein